MHVNHQLIAFAARRVAGSETLRELDEYEHLLPKISDPAAMRTALRGLEDYPAPQQLRIVHAILRESRDPEMHRIAVATLKTATFEQLGGLADTELQTLCDKTLLGQIVRRMSGACYIEGAEQKCDYRVGHDLYPELTTIEREHGRIADILAASQSAEVQMIGVQEATDKVVRPFTTYRFTRVFTGLTTPEAHAAYIRQVSRLGYAMPKMKPIGYNSNRAIHARQARSAETEYAPGCKKAEKGAAIEQEHFVASILNSTRDGHIDARAAVVQKAFRQLIMAVPSKVFHASVARMLPIAHEDATSLSIISQMRNSNMPAGQLSSIFDGVALRSQAPQVRDMLFGALPLTEAPYGTRFRRLRESAIADLDRDDGETSRRGVATAITQLKHLRPLAHLPYDGGDHYREFRALRNVAGKDSRFVAGLAEYLPLTNMTAERDAETSHEEYARNREEYDRLRDHGFTNTATTAALERALARIEAEKPLQKKI